MSGIKREHGEYPWKENENAGFSQRSTLTQLCGDHNTDNPASQLFFFFSFNCHVSEDVTVSK